MPSQTSHPLSLELLSYACNGAVFASPWNLQMNHEILAPLSRETCAEVETTTKQIEKAFRVSHHW